MRRRQPSEGETEVGGWGHRPQTPFRRSLTLTASPFHGVLGVRHKPHPSDGWDTAPQAGRHVLVDSHYVPSSQLER